MSEYREYRLTRESCDTQPRVRVLVSGFGDQDIVSIDEVVAAVDVLPNRHLAGLEEIRYDPTRRTQSLLSFFLGRSSSKRHCAQFVSLVNSIYIYRFASKPQFHEILYHEIGHHVFHRVIDSSLRKHWVTVLYPGSGHVSSYAATNAAEDFAESYAFFVLQPEAMRRLPEKFAFLQDHVFIRPPARPNSHLDLRL